MMLSAYTPEYSDRSDAFTVALVTLQWEYIESERNALRYKIENDKLRTMIDGYAATFDKWAAENNGNGPYFSGEDWLSLANEIRIELAEISGELTNNAVDKQE